MTGEEAIQLMTTTPLPDMSEGKLFDCRDALEVAVAVQVQFGGIDTLAETLQALDDINDELDKRDEELT